MTADDDTPAVLYIRANRSGMIHRYEVLPPGRTDGERWVPEERLMEAERRGMERAAQICTDAEDSIFGKSMELRTAAITIRAEAAALKEPKP